MLFDHWPFLIATALVASTIAALAGTGGGVILLPVLVSTFGVRDAVPIYALAQLIGNLSRIGFNRTLISYRVVAWFSLGVVPLAVLGAWVFTQIPDTGLLKILGAFLIFFVVIRRLHPTLHKGFPPYWFAPIGGVFSLISAIVGSAGPFLAPFYLSYGLTKGAFIGTEAFGTAIMHVVKLSSYQGLGVMSHGIWSTGFMLGPIMIIGSYTGKQLLDRISTHAFLIIVEVAIVGFGLWFLFR